MFDGPNELLIIHSESMTQSTALVGLPSFHRFFFSFLIYAIKNYTHQGTNSLANVRLVYIFVNPTTKISGLIQ